MNTIFLDFDGVINSINYWDKFEGQILVDEPFDNTNIVNLNYITTMAKAQIVITSFWTTFGYTFQQLKTILINAGVTGDIVYKTHIISGNPIRGIEIQTYLHHYPSIKRFVILDDKDNMGFLKDHLVQTDIQVGLTIPNALDAVALMENQTPRK